MLATPSFALGHHFGPQGVFLEVQGAPGTFFGPFGGLLTLANLDRNPCMKRTSGPPDLHLECPLGNPWTPRHPFWSTGHPFWSTVRHFWSTRHPFWSTGHPFWSTVRKRSPKWNTSGQQVTKVEPKGRQILSKVTP